MALRTPTGTRRHPSVPYAIRPERDAVSLWVLEYDGCDDERRLFAVADVSPDPWGPDADIVADALEALVSLCRYGREAWGMGDLQGLRGKPVRTGSPGCRKVDRRPRVGPPLEQWFGRPVTEPIAR